MTHTPDDPGQPGREGPPVEAARPPSPLARIRPIVLAAQASRPFGGARQITPGGQLQGTEYPPEVIAVIEAEWRAGLTSVADMARESGVPRSLIYQWSTQKGWGDRASARARAREAIDATVIERAVASFRTEHPEAAAAVSEAAQDIAGSRADQLLADYSVVVASVVEAQRKQATDVAGLGDQLIRMYRESVEGLAAKYGVDDIGRVKLVQAFLSSYATLVRAVAQAHDLQRAAYGLNAPGEGGDSSSGGGGDGVTWQPGTYDDVVREAEARGERLA